MRLVFGILPSRHRVLLHGSLVSISSGRLDRCLYGSSTGSMYHSSQSFGSLHGGFQFRLLLGLMEGDSGGLLL